MKHLILLCILTVTLNSFSQGKEIGVSWDSPSTGSSIYSNVQFNIDMTITNTGNIDIVPDDSIFVTLTIGGNNALPAAYLAPREDPNNTNQQTTLQPGDSYTYTFTNMSIPNITTTSTQEVCVRALLLEDNSAAPVFDTQDCVDLIFDADADVGIHTENIELIQLYPNPVAEQLQVEVNNLSILKIINSNGQISLVKNLSIGNNSIDVTSLPTGIYFYQITDSNQPATISGKLIIE